MIKKTFILILFLFIYINILYPQTGNKFVFTQLKYKGNWDPYPYIYRDIYSFLTLTTNVKAEKERRIITLADKILFYSPFIVLLNGGDFPGFTPVERSTLRNYLNNGGILFIEDTTCNRFSKFDSLIRKELSLILPEYKLEKLSPSSALYKSFYLLRGISGRKILNNYLEVIELSGRIAVIYSQNDILGCWAKDNFGNYFLECIPGGEQQRFEAQKLTINIIVFSVTSSYKSDIIHRPFIEEKLKRAP